MPAPMSTVTNDRFAIYYDMDQFGTKENVHKALQEEFKSLNISLQKYVGTDKNLNNLPKFIPDEQKIDISENKKKKNAVDHEIMLQLMEDNIRDPTITHFIIASRDTDFIRISKTIHMLGKQFGVLYLDNKKEAISELLFKECHILWRFKDKKITQIQGLKKKPDTPPPVVRVQTPFSAPPPLPPKPPSPLLLPKPAAIPQPKRLLFFEKYSPNIVLIWMDFRCKSYKEIAVQLDDLIEEYRNEKPLFPLPLHFELIQRDQQNYFLGPHALNCICGKIPSPFRESEDKCPVFLFYKNSELVEQVVGPDLKRVREVLDKTYYA